MGDPVDQFDRAVNAALASGHIFFILDLEAMPVVDSCGIGALVNTLKLATARGGDAKLLNPSPFATKTLKMVCILNLFSVFTTETSAVAACGG